jgi:hypothetical protein
MTPEEAAAPLLEQCVYQTSADETIHKRRREAGLLRKDGQDITEELKNYNYSANNLQEKHHKGELEITMVNPDRKDELKQRYQHKGKVLPKKRT